MLQSTIDFNNPLITIPVKHHGHMIEEFYADEEYQSIEDEQLKQDIEHIIFAVRDADKIANWQLVTNEFDIVKGIWLRQPHDCSPEQAVISPKVWAYFTSRDIVPNNERITNADNIIAVLCWLFDINYRYSIVYSQKLNLINKFLLLLERMGVDSDKIIMIKATIHQFAKDKFGIEL